MPTVRNLRGIDIFAARQEESRIVEIQVKTIQKESGARFWFVGQSRSDIPDRKALFYVFVCPSSKAEFAAFECCAFG